MLVPELLLDILEDLGSDEFQKFKWFLSWGVLESCKPIPRSHLENASRADTVQRIMLSYMPEVAVSNAVEILKKMGNNFAAAELARRHTEGNKATPSSSSSASSSVSSAVAPPVAPATISATAGSTIIAPIVTCGTTGTFNINVTRKE